METCEPHILLRMTVVSIDFYMKRPTEAIGLLGHLDDSNSQLPVVRIFGSNDLGQRALCHIHGALPYLYFRPPDMFDCHFKDKSEVNNCLTSFRDQLESILQRRVEAKQPNQNYRKEPETHIMNMSVVEKKSMYGCFDSTLFVKVKYRDPSHKNDIVYCLEVFEPVKLCWFPFNFCSTLNYCS